MKKATIYFCDWLDKESGEVLTYEKEIDLLPSKDGRRLKQLQILVGGMIDIYEHEGNDLVFNDEGYIVECPLNSWAISQGLQLYGTIVKVDGILD